MYMHVDIQERCKDYGEGKREGGSAAWTVLRRVDSAKPDASATR